MWKVTFAIGSLLLLSVHAEARPYHRHHYYRPELFQSMASISGGDRIVSPPFGMPACLTIKSPGNDPRVIQGLAVSIEALGGVAGEQGSKRRRFSLSIAIYQSGT